jgi:hypothetical protein
MKKITEQTYKLIYGLIEDSYETDIEDNFANGKELRAKELEEEKKKILNEFSEAVEIEYSKKQCAHDWHWHYDCFEDARLIDDNKIGIPSQCSICGREAIEWYEHKSYELTN